MPDSGLSVLDGLNRQRQALLQTVLWVSMGVVVMAAVISAFLLGGAFFTVASVGSNLLNIALLGAALWLNDRQKMRASVWLMMGTTLLVGGTSLVQGGISENLLQLYVYFIPVAIAGVLLSRRELYLTAGLILGLVLSSPLLHGPDLRLGDYVLAGGAWSVALPFSLVLGAVTLILDRFGIALQSSLRRAVAQEAAYRDELAGRLRISENLNEEQAFNTAIVENLPGIFYVLDEAGKFVRWNNNFSTALGYGEDELPGMNRLELVGPEDYALIEQDHAEAFASGRSSTAVTLISKEGRRIPFVLNRARVSLGGVAYLAGIGLDRSEIDDAQTRIQALNVDLAERLERITALHEIDKAITGSLDMNTTLKVVLEQVTRRLHVDAAAILLYRPSSESLRYGAGLGLGGTDLQRTNLRVGEGFAGRAALDRELVIVSDPEEFRQGFVRSAYLGAEKFESYVAFPLVAKGELQGVLELFHHSRLETDDDWRAYLVTIGMQAAIAVDSSSMFNDLQRSHQELRLAYDATIEGWARALDLKDEETEGHSRRVTELTVRLAESMGMSEEEIVHVRRGALLHDIGKMGIPDSILLKPGKLDSSEWELMKRHTIFARDFLAPIPFLRDAIDIPYAHHEKWDGTGYPRGLAGEQIPLAARLFAVVDVYDALTNDRPYRAAWSKERTLAYIREQRGVHFEPAVVDAFLELLQRE